MTENLDKLFRDERPTEPRLELADQLRTMMCTCPETPKPPAKVRDDE